MAYCPNCGKQVKDISVFCLYCGQKLRQKEQQVETSKQKENLHNQLKEEVEQQPQETVTHDVKEEKTSVIKEETKVMTDVENEKKNV